MKLSQHFSTHSRSYFLSIKAPFLFSQSRWTPGKERREKREARGSSLHPPPSTRPPTGPLRLWRPRVEVGTGQGPQGPPFTGKVCQPSPRRQLGHECLPGLQPTTQKTDTSGSGTDGLSYHYCCINTALTTCGSVSLIGHLSATQHRD